MTFKAAIFDLDGTLLASLKGIGDAMNAVLQRRGYMPHPIDEYCFMVGSGIETLVERALPKEWFEQNEKEEKFPELVKEYRSDYDRIWPKETHPYDGINDMLDQLTAMNIKIAVLSNKSEDFTKRMVYELLPNRKFESIRGARPGIPIKPDPVAALEMAAQMNLSPREIMFIGDTGIDMATAVNAGMHPVGVTWGFRSIDELKAKGAKELIHHPSALVDIITKQKIKN